MNQMLLYALLVGSMLTLYRVGAKLILVNPLRASFLGAIITALVSGIILLYMRPSLENLYEPQNIRGLVLAGSVLVISGIFVVKGFQKGFPVSVYSTLYTICGLIMVVLY